ncbi:hypothetical protein EJB05_56660 [Eragrostis curvula]|uniref:Uncharacterized protein n=1 Tax=Eragrostis curvula TaxID=38414 RepID=A0A5J9SGU6_9POAL|nr:hypothetical protein EJB05_56660 [Eragrostis curvula]
MPGSPPPPPLAMALEVAAQEDALSPIEMAIQKRDWFENKVEIPLQVMLGKVIQSLKSPSEPVFQCNEGYENKGEIPLKVMLCKVMRSLCSSVSKKNKHSRKEEVKGKGYDDKVDIPLKVMRSLRSPAESAYSSAWYLLEVY